MSDLATFLRARREQLRPTDVGLPDRGRRRTPGLRREEVAALAGVSVDYLIRLEQGRDTHPSASVIYALADALQLDEAERRHLGQLAAISAHGELCPTATSGDEVPATALTLLAALDPSPAFVLSPSKDLLAWNPAFERVAGPLGLLDPPNLARWTFLSEAAKDAYDHWDEVADQLVAQLRAAEPRWSSDADYAALLDDLRDVDEFARRWAAYEVEPKGRGAKELRHPTLGPLRFDLEVLRFDDVVDRLLVTWLPADEATEAALRPRLRSVG